MFNNISLSVPDGVYAIAALAIAASTNPASPPAAPSGAAERQIKSVTWAAEKYYGWLREQARK